MDRINITSRDEETGEIKTIGWFDRDRATEWAEETRWDGNNNVPLVTGSWTEHQKLWRTAQGRWVIHCWSAWQGTQDSWRYIDADEARNWLITNEYSAEAIAEAGLGDLPEESGPNLGGRPAIGGKALLALGDDLLARLDAEADRRGMTRAALAREVLAAGLQ